MGAEGSQKNGPCRHIRQQAASLRGDTRPSVGVGVPLGRPPVRTASPKNTGSMDCMGFPTRFPAQCLLAATNNFVLFIQRVYLVFNLRLSVLLDVSWHWMCLQRISDE
ncbi:hypothetical protein CEXT_76211 [Caerostris extrusa]|uniref:Uncharacterized protein n=1 Tax=Caerostris extrusa TaxID=172846 RepID=A0AAV4P9B0_CAEEX|nr:hypothetical protein CEXT_76211 [Caerostris extrusa]